eukprot:TRINITY_DN3137_c0_g1_i2.p1 TRINITY_DN3137_c0_g1~~TRINITY_DN3137_c0_g1_i2.p1  ORF type:complete len:560 (-),score=107.69 TRINITY_DN3137_c0_g1_i2:520-2013(-)
MKGKKRKILLFPSNRTIVYMPKVKNDHVKKVMRVDWLNKFKVSKKKKEIKMNFKWSDKSKKLHVNFTTKSATQQFGYLIRAMKASQDLPDHISLFIGTWNVGNAPPAVDSFHPWLPLGHDLYVIGAQECEYVARKGYSSCGNDWCETISAHMGPDYVLVKKASMWQIRTLVFTKVNLMNYISNVDKSIEPTGIGSVMGNKGGVGVTLNFLETSLCFINSHLAAHQENINDRNEDVKEVIDNLHLNKKKDVTTMFEHAFWFGDLNYRIENSREQVIQKVHEWDLEALYEDDQLKSQMESNKVFFGFREAPITFKPTYKFDRGTRNEYSEDRNRVPSWCDRILVSSWNPTTIHQTDYHASHELMTSDHSPIYGTFDVEISRPWVPADIGRECTIGLYNLRAKNLNSGDSNGFSDPYLKIQGDWIEINQKTTFIKKTLNPIWKDEVIAVVPFVSDPDYLETKHLSLVVLDKDRVGYALGTLSFYVFDSIPANDTIIYLNV